MSVQAVARQGVTAAPAFAEATAGRQAVIPCVEQMNGSARNAGSEPR